MVMTGCSGQEGKMIMSVEGNESIMSGFLRARDARPEIAAIVSDDVAASWQQALVAQGLVTATDLLAEVLWPSLDMEGRIAMVARLQDALQVEESATPSHR